MTISEKSAYLKGLMDGLKLNTESDEGKMIAAIVDLLGDVTKKVVDIEDTTIAISDELDEIEEDLDAIEDYILDEEDDYDEDEDEDDEFWPYDEDDEEEEDDEMGLRQHHRLRRGGSGVRQHRLRQMRRDPGVLLRGRRRAVTK